jgi:lysophospholipase L1-like esterase
VPISAGTFKVTAKWPAGATCESLPATAPIRSKIAITWKGLKNGKLVKAAKDTTTIASLAEQSSPAGLTLLSAPIAKPKSLFAGETATLTIVLDQDLSGCSAASGITALDFTGVNGSSSLSIGSLPPPPPDVPSSMAALGDSLTRAYNACSSFSDCPDASWSTGSLASVNSHYSRILALNPNISGNADNDAQSGAPMSSLAGQVNTAIGQGAEYVTILMGANDACKSSEGAMTPVSTFQDQFQQAMNTLTAGLPEAKILVVSIPDLLRVWFIGNNNPDAREAWSSFPICDSMLANPTSTDQADVDRRARVRQRVVDFNTALATVCAEVAKCKFDGNAVFDHQWTPSEISTIDYFHPSSAGQATIASLTYAAGYNW